MELMDTDRAWELLSQLFPCLAQEWRGKLLCKSARRVQLSELCCLKRGTKWVRSRKGMVHLPVAQLLTGSSLLGCRHWHSWSAANNIPTDWVQFAVVTDLGSKSGIV